MVLLVLISLAVAACSAQPTSSNVDSAALAGTCITNSAGPLALVIGARSNVPTPQLPPFVETLLENAAAAGQPISLVDVDGRPSVTTPSPFSSNAGNSAAREAALNRYVQGYAALLASRQDRAQVAQANVLAALDLAAEATGPGGNIVVVDSGLQTVAPLEYQDSDLLSAPPSDVVSFLQEQQLLPNLSGRHVVLVGFGYTAAPQPSLDQAQQDNVRGQWEAIVKAGGGCVTLDTQPNTAAEIAGLPPVTVVSLPATPTFNSCGTTVLADAGSVGFIVGTATFRDPSAAEATLAKLAATLKQGTARFELIGSTSSEGGNAVNDPLSLARARAVARVLISDGVSASRITAVGEGSHWAGRVPDIGPGGGLLPGPAEEDREVIVQLPKCQ